MPKMFLILFSIRVEAKNERFVLSKEDCYWGFGPYTCGSS